MWAACRDTSLNYDCNSQKAAARVDLLSATSSDGTLFTSPSVVSPATTGRTVNDRNPEFSGGALLHQSSYVNLAVAVEVSTQIKGIHAIGEFVFLRE